MEIIYSNNSIKTSKKNCIALGNFDGVHIGHKSIIKAAVDYALNNDANSCVYTFRTHTSHTLGSSKKMLTTNSEKCNILENLGCTYTYFEDFDSIKNLTPEEFCKKILKDKLNAMAVFCGENYRFGKNAQGNTEILKKELSKHNIELFVLPYEFYNEKIISSTEIRNSLTAGELNEANDMLGRCYCFSGEVLPGKKLGRKLGFPTLNIEIPDMKLVPLLGVYLTVSILNGKKYYGITNIGNRPTTDEAKNSKVNCETFLLDYDGDAYGSTLKVNLVCFLRPETRFSSVDELKSRVLRDITDAKDYFMNNKTEIQI